jgi:hypothetical protein
MQKTDEKYHPKGIHALSIAVGRDEGPYFKHLVERENQWVVASVYVWVLWSTYHNGLSRKVGKYQEMMRERLPEAQGMICKSVPNDVLRKYSSFNENRPMGEEGKMRRPPL